MMDAATLPDRESPALPEAWFRRIFWWGLLGLFAVRLAYYLFHDLADGGSRVPQRLFEEVTGIVTAVPFVWATLAIARRRRLAAPPWGRALAGAGGLFVVCSLLHTTAMLVARRLLGPVLGLGDYVPTALGSRYLYEMANDVLPVGLLFTAVALAEQVAALAARERREAALERSLLEAELRALRLQLQPHFLFNALNTVSSAMYEDPARADRLLGHLAELLRTSLRTTHAHEVPVREELALLDQYLALMRARFGDRLVVRVDADDDALGGLVPSMVLQPLVENAVRHGGVARAGRGVATVTVRREGDGLLLRVHDDGPGLPPGRDAFDAGTGLSATARRLRLMHGDLASMTAANVPEPERGFAVTLRLPWRTAPAAVPAGVPAAGARDLVDAGAAR